jgi:hypothetical protein
MNLTFLHILLYFYWKRIHFIFGMRFQLGDRYPEFCRSPVRTRSYLQDVFQLVTNYHINRCCTVRATNSIVNKKFGEAVIAYFPLLLNWPHTERELSWVYFTADGQSTSSSWYRAPLWGPWPDFIFILSLVTVALLFFLDGDLSDERTGL